MKRILLFVLFAIGLVGVAAAGSQPPPVTPGPAPRNAPTGSLKPNHGRIACAAAINSNGSVATRITTGNPGHIDFFGTTRLGVGLYQVAFDGPCSDVRSLNGWFRWVQPDDLSNGAVGPRYCTVADRLNFFSAVFVECFNQAGVLTDTSFTITLSR